MAIAFAILQFTTLRPDKTSVGLFAYLGRCSARDHDRSWAYRHLAGDLVHHEVLLPPGVPARYADPMALARAMDEAEPRARLALQRQRYPQPGLHLVLALPPDSEMHLDEVVVLVRTFVHGLIGTSRIGAYITIHDPAVLHNARLLRNRHAHVVLPRRDFDGAVLSRHKRRDLVARVRTAAGGGVAGRRPTYVAEGVRWPDLWWAAQNRTFLELGSTTRVQPIAAHAERHHDRQTMRTQRFEVEADRERTLDQNRRAAFGDPPALITALARGRSALLLADLQAFLARVIPEPRRRQDLLTAIRAHDAVLALTYDGIVDRITTDAIHARVAEACAAIRAAASDADARIVCVRGEDEDEVRAGIARAAAGVHVRSDDAIIIVGAALSHTDVLRDRGAIRTRLRDLLARGTARPPSLIVAPRAELIRDTDLADLIGHATRAGCRLILGVDDRGADGVVDRRLAVVAAALLDPRPVPPDLTPDSLRSLAARRLRAGYLVEGIAALSGAAVTIAFGVPAPVASHATVVVAARARRGRPHPGASDILEYGPEWIDEAACVPGARVIARRTDYAVLPPVVRAGRLYEVVERIVEEKAEPVLRLRDVATGTATTLPIAAVTAGFRPERPLTVREAGALKGHLAAPVRIVLADPAQAWASLLLAAEWGAVPSIHVDVLPQVATTLQDLVARVSADLPAALAIERTAGIDHAAREDVATDALLTSILPAPESAPPADEVLKDTDLLKLPETLAAAVAKDPLVREGVDLRLAALRAGRSPREPDHDPLAEALMPLVAPGTRRGRKPAYTDDLDLPEGIVANEPAVPSLLDAWLLPKAAELEAILARVRARRGRAADGAVGAGPPATSSDTPEDPEGPPTGNVRPRTGR